MPNSKPVVDGDLSVVRWGALEPVIPTPATDPRSEMNEQALIIASRNAFPIVAQRRSRRDNLGIATGAAIALVLGCVTFVTLSSGRNGSREPISAQSSPGYAVQTPQIPSAVPTATPQVVPPSAQQPSAAIGPMAPPQTVVLPNASRSQSPVMVYDGSTIRTSGAPGVTDGSADAPAPGMLALGSDPNGSSVTDTAAARSTRIGDPSHTVAQGTLIPAVLETAINSDVPGYVRAVVSQDVRSFDGSQVLVPRSSRLIGEYKTGLAAGQRRAYLIWTRLLRPDGVSVALSSPSVDFSGESGVGGRVNSHFLQRFGSAILLSVLGGASALASGGATVVVSGGQSAASVAAQQNGARPPTIHVRPGEPIRVFTARDLIFAPIDRKSI